MASTYTVKVGDTIRDVCINATGSMSNWDTICKANGFTTWTPVLAPGQLIAIPDAVFLDSNTLADKRVYPASNSGPANALEVLTTIWNILTDRWILRNGVWDDSGIWIDTAFWKDNP